MGSTGVNTGLELGDDKICVTYTITEETGLGLDEIWGWSSGQTSSEFLGDFSELNRGEIKCQGSRDIQRYPEISQQYCKSVMGHNTPLQCPCRCQLSLIARKLN